MKAIFQWDEVIGAWYSVIKLFGINTIKISHHPIVIGVNSLGRLLTVMTDQVVVFIGMDGDVHSFLLLVQRWFHHLDSTKIEEGINRYLGHRFASSGWVLLIQILYPESKRCPFLLGLLINYLGEEPPDLKGCSAFGHTLEEALREVQIAKKAWIEAALSEGIPTPSPRYRPVIYQVSG